MSISDAAVHEIRDRLERVVAHLEAVKAVQKELYGYVHRGVDEAFEAAQDALEDA